jgi:hypothetical protein
MASDVQASLKRVKCQQKVRRMPGLFRDEPPTAQLQDSDVTDNSKKSRERAEAAFNKTQTQLMALTRLASEQDAVSQARVAKTARLRELRLAKEANDLAAAVTAPKRRAKG